jgi:F-type H+-transporting ATPase subunit gamma
VRRILCVVIASDRGLCGGFNNTLLRRAHDFIKAKRQAGVEVEIVAYGRKASDFFTGRRIALANVTLDWAKADKMDLVRPLGDRMVAGFVDHLYDEVYVVSNKFVSTLVQEPSFDRMLPFEVDLGEDEDGGGDYRYEPGPEQILAELLPLYIRTLILQKFLETEAGEHAARMTAMDNATRNASELIDTLTLDYNRARQAAITTELIEIVSGAAAL